MYYILILLKMMLRNLLKPVQIRLLMILIGWKILIFKLDDIAFVSHLRMEGKYHYVEHDEPLNKHDHIIFNLDDNKQVTL